MSFGSRCQSSASFASSGYQSGSQASARSLGSASSASQRSIWAGNFANSQSSVNSSGFGSMREPSVRSVGCGRSVCSERVLDLGRCSRSEPRSNTGYQQSSRDYGVFRFNVFGNSDSTPRYDSQPSVGEYRSPGPITYDPSPDYGSYAYYQYNEEMRQARKAKERYEKLEKERRLGPLPQSYQNVKFEKTPEEKYLQRANNVEFYSTKYVEMKKLTDSYKNTIDKQQKELKAMEKVLWDIQNPEPSLLQQTEMWLRHRLTKKEHSRLQKLQSKQTKEHFDLDEDPDPPPPPQGQTRSRTIPWEIYGSSGPPRVRIGTKGYQETEKCPLKHGPDGCIPANEADLSSNRTHRRNPTPLETIPEEAEDGARYQQPSTTNVRRGYRPQNHKMREVKRDRDIHTLNTKREDVGSSNMEADPETMHRARTSQSTETLKQKVRRHREQSSGCIDEMTAENFQEAKSTGPRRPRNSDEVIYSDIDWNSSSSRPSISRQPSPRIEERNSGRVIPDVHQTIPEVKRNIRNRMGPNKKTVTFADNELAGDINMVIDEGNEGADDSSTRQPDVNATSSQRSEFSQHHDHTTQPGADEPSQPTAPTPSSPSNGAADWTESDTLTVFGYSMNSTNLECLKHNCELEDDVILTYMAAKIEAEQRRGVGIGMLSSNFLRFDEIEIARNVSEIRVFENPEELQYIGPEIHTLLVPINPGGHWYLCRISINKREIEIMDSLQRSEDMDRLYIDNIERLEAMLNMKYPNSRWTTRVVDTVFHQTSKSNDCGVHLLNQVDNITKYGEPGELRYPDPSRKEIINFLTLEMKKRRGTGPSTSPYHVQGVEVGHNPGRLINNDRSLTDRDFSILNEFSNTVARKMADLRKGVVFLSSSSIMLPNRVMWSGDEILIDESAFTDVPSVMSQIFVPVRIGLHWSLLRILPRLREMEIYDTSTVSEARTIQLKEVVSVLSSRIVSGYGTLPWEVTVKEDIPRPANTDNSALFMMWYLKCLFERTRLTFDCNAKTLSSFRDQMNDMLTSRNFPQEILPPVLEFYAAKEVSEPRAAMSDPALHSNKTDIFCDDFRAACHSGSVKNRQYPMTETPMTPANDATDEQGLRETGRPDQIRNVSANGAVQNPSTKETCNPDIASTLSGLNISNGKSRSRSRVTCCFCEEDITNLRRSHNINPAKMVTPNVGDKEVVEALQDLDSLNRNTNPRPTGFICPPCGNAVKRISKGLKVKSEAISNIQQTCQSVSHGGILGSSLTVDGVQLSRCYNCQKITTLVKVSTTVRRRQYTVCDAWKKAREQLNLSKFNEEAMRSLKICRACIGQMTEFMDAANSTDLSAKRLSWFTTTRNENHVVPSTPSKQSTSKHQGLFSPTGFTPVSKKAKRKDSAGLLFDETLMGSPGVEPFEEIDESINYNIETRFEQMETSNRDITSQFQKLLDQDFEKFFRESGLRTYGPPSMSQIKDLNFNDLEIYIRENLPAMVSIFPVAANGEIKITPAEITAVCILAHSRHPSCNLFQTVHSLDLWKRLTKEQMRHYNTLGLTSSRFTAYRTADKLCEENQSAVDEWKADEETQWRQQLEVQHNPGAAPVKHSRRNLAKEFERDALPEGITTARVFDNVDIHIKSRHQGPFSSNTMLNQHGGYYLRNRIPVPRRTTSVSQRAGQLSVEHFTLSDDEIALLRAERTELLKFIACQNIPYLKDNRFYRFCKSRDVKFPELSKSKSDLIPTGLIDQEVGTVKGTMAVLDRLDKDTPTVGGKKMPIRVVGDCKTFLQIDTAKSLGTAAMEAENFNHIYPSTGDFHARMALLQRLMNTFKLNIGLKRSIGTLSNIKDTQKHRNASGNSAATFDYDYELCEATMHGFGTLLMLDKLSIPDINASPQGVVDLNDPIACEKYLNDAATAASDVFDEVLGGYLQNRIRRNLCKPEEDVTCSNCHTEGEERAVECGNKFCEDLVHEACAISSNNEGLPSEKLYCSLDCYRHSVCLCGLEAGMESVTCSNRYCLRDIHESCSITEPRDTFDGKVYCSRVCADRKFAYTIALLHCCLSQKLRRDAIRWNDAKMMYLHWKESMPYFYSSGNPHFFKMAHYIVLCENECVPENIAFDEYFNRTVNVSGNADSNLSADLVMEHHVRHHKEEFKRMTGKPTQQSLKRRTQIKFAEQEFKQMLGNVSGHSRVEGKGHVARNYCKETEEFCNYYHKYNLVNAVGRREHETLADFDYNPFVQPHKVSAFAAKVKEFSTAFDLTNDMAIHFVDDETTYERLSQPMSYSVPSLLQGKTDWKVGNHEVTRDSWWLEICQRFGGVPVPNDVQYKAAREVYEGNDALVGLPTGFGKSLIYVYATLLRHLENSVDQLTACLVITPILSLITDQIFKLAGYGLLGVDLTQQTEDAVSVLLENLKRSSEENLLFLFLTPEQLATEEYLNLVLNIKPELLVVDEAHLVKDWGSEFRTAFDQIGGVRYNYGGNVLAMTATLASDAYEFVVNSLGMTSDRYEIISRADRPNLYMAGRKLNQKNKFLLSVATCLKKYGPNCPKMIIYCPSYSEINKEYRKIMKFLKGFAYVGQENTVSTRMIHLYYGQLGTESKLFIQDAFRASNTPARVVFATSAFGLGIDIPDVRIVAYIPPKIKSLATDSEILQAVGRCSRDGLPGIGVVFMKNPPVGECFREFLLRDFVSPNVHLNPQMGHVVSCNRSCVSCFCRACVCCDRCRHACECRVRNLKTKIDYIDSFIENASATTGELESEDELE